ncbi:MAG: hypothetical protein MZV65_42395 [Chromatiales bacterium]|nr:hypothetical protein [Chromatiales bacterium]
MVKFWKRESGGVPSEATSTTPAKSSDPEKLAALEQAALDQLASVLRTWGQYAFDLDEIKAATLAEQLERWSRHVLMAAPPDASRHETDRPRGHPPARAATGRVCATSSPASGAASSPMSIVRSWAPARSWASSCRHWAWCSPRIRRSRPRSRK